LLDTLALAASGSTAAKAVPIDIMISKTIAYP
jgi:hypothetical protein